MLTWGEYSRGKPKCLETLYKFYKMQLGKGEETRDP